MIRFDRADGVGGISATADADIAGLDPDLDRYFTIGALRRFQMCGPLLSLFGMSVQNGQSIVEDRQPRMIAAVTQPFTFAK